MRLILKQSIAVVMLLTMTSKMQGQETPVPVTVAQAVEEAIASSMLLTGTVTAKRQARLSSRTAGLIQTLKVDAGSLVKAGDVLMQLDDTLAKLTLEKIQAENDSAQTELTEARRQLAEVSGLIKVGGVSKSEVETRQSSVRVREAALKSTEVQLREQKEIIDRHRLLAPFDGVISGKLAEEGEWVQTNAAVVELVETGNLLLDVQAPQEVFVKLKGQAEVVVQLDAYAGETFKAKVDTLVPVKDPVARTFLARIKLDDPGHLAAPGMSASVQFRFSGEKAVHVPRDAIVRSQDGSARVWTLRGQEEGVATVSARVVKVGTSLRDLVVILEGLEPGEVVVLHGNEALRDGQKVRVIQPDRKS